MSIKGKSKTITGDKIAIWILVISAIALLNYYAVNQSTIHLPIFDNIRYGDFLFQKWLLPIIAFLVFGYFLLKEKHLSTSVLKQHLLPIFLVSIFLITARFISFGHWFYHDDLGIVSYHFYDTSLQGMSCCAPGYYSLGLMFLLIRWFGHVFEAYKAVGLFVHFLVGMIIYVLSNSLQKNKTVSLIVAIFFVTTPTNYYQTISALEFMGDSFSLLLFILAVYTLIKGYWSNSVIFAAAAMEFGLSRTHFISLPLLMVLWFFAPRVSRWKPQWIMSAGAFLILPFTYLRVFGHVTGPNGTELEWNPLFVYASVLLSVTIPHNIIFPLFKNLRVLTSNSPYIAPFIGILIITILFSIFVWFIYKKKSATKILSLGLIILLVSIVFPVLRGSRITSDFLGLTNQFLSGVPALSTGYGIFPAFGLVLILIIIIQNISFKIFKIALVPLIIFNTISYMKLDSNFADLYAVSERAVNKQMLQIVPDDGKAKIIYVPDRSKFYIALMRFIEIFRAKENITIDRKSTR